MSKLESESEERSAIPSEWQSPSEWRSTSEWRLPSMSLSRSAYWSQLVQWSSMDLPRSRSMASAQVSVSEPDPIRGQLLRHPSNLRTTNRIDPRRSAP